MARKKTPLPTSLSSARRLLRRDKRLLSFGFFLLTSIVLWTLNKFSYSYTYDLPAKIELHTLKPATYMITEGNSAQAMLRVRARGYDLLRYKLFSSKKFKAPISQSFILDLPIGNAGIATAQIRNAVAQQLGTSYELQSIAPDSLYFKVTRVAAKKVPVRGDFRITYAPQYMQRGQATINPDSVIVSGGQSALENINEIRTVPLVREKVSAGLSGKMDLITPPQTILSYNKISYSIDIQRFIEISYELPIHLLYVPDSLNVQLLPSSAKVTFSVTMEEYPQLKREELYMQVNYRELNNSLSGQLRVMLSHPPGYVLSTTISPAFVNVISERKP